MELMCVYTEPKENNQRYEETAKPFTKAIGNASCSSKTNEKIRIFSASVPVEAIAESEGIEFSPRRCSRPLIP